MSSVVLEYKRVRDKGWLFGLIFHDQKLVRTDMIVGECGYTARELPFEIVAQLCWRIGRGASGFFSGHVEVFDTDSCIRGFDLNTSGRPLPGTFLPKNGHRIFFPAGLEQLRELLRADVTSPVVRVMNQQPIEVSFTMSRFGWTAHPDDDDVVVAAALTAQALHLNMRPFDALRKAEPSTEQFFDFDV